MNNVSLTIRRNRVKDELYRAMHQQVSKGVENWIRDRTRTMGLVDHPAPNACFRIQNGLLYRSAWLPTAGMPIRVPRQLNLSSPGA